MNQPKSIQTVLVTGASGMLAQRIIELLTENDYCLIAASSRPSVAQERNVCSGKIAYVSNTQLFDESFAWNEIDALVHCAFTRRNEQQDVLSSLDFAKSLFSKAEKSNIQRVINISSRSVYLDPHPGELNTEESPLGGGGCIGLGKVATEMFLELLFSNTQCSYTSLRVASVNEVKKEDAMKRPMNVFVQQVIRGETIEIQGGKQVMSYIDVRDVANAVLSTLRHEKELKPVYNVGTGWTCTKTLLEIAELVQRIGVERFGLQKNEIRVVPKDISMHSGLNIDRIQRDMGWDPQYTLENMVEQLYGMYLEK